MNRRSIFTFSILFFFIPIKSQELETGLSFNPSLEKKIITKKSASADTLSLPFFDDFSGTDPYPNSKYWADRNVFINSTFEVEPISTGVATFDALDENGNVYILKSLISGSDTLTSNPLNLSGKTDVYLSFFYQPGGMGDSPEEQDSLKLEFKTPNDSVWNTQFQVAGTSLRDFKQIILPVENEYLFDGFQFRFTNKVSLNTEKDFDGYGSNADQWNLDYIYLNENRSLSDTTYRDVTITTPVPGIFKNYETIPWSHFNLASNTEKVGTIPITINNLNHEDEDALKVNVFYYLQDLKNPDYEEEDQYFWFNLDPNTKEIVNGDLTFDFTSPSDPTKNDAEFYMRLNLKDETETLNIRRGNDTISKIIKFKDYYAYDDGSPEAGYGFKGNAVKNVMVALRYNTYKKDTLKNIYMYFNPTRDSSNNNLAFELRVWNSLNNEPSDVIYEKTVWVNSLSKNFEKYSLDEEIILDGDFFIGWRHLSNDYLNVGLDKNNSVTDKLLYNKNGYWTASSIEGAIMLRPGFGTPVISSVKNNILNEFPLKVYPNPASNYINIEIENEDYSHDISLEIIDLSGRLLISKNLQDSKTVDISNLKTGIYLVLVKNNTNILAKQKLLVQ